MLTVSDREPITVSKHKRIIGTYKGGRRGPTVICVGGIHGNEPAGVTALGRVIQKLETSNPVFHGELLALAGNLGALNQNIRFQERDLNRMWSPGRMKALRLGTGRPTRPEEYEQTALLAEIEAALLRKTGPAIFLDLHTTSAWTVPFALLSDTLANRKLVSHLGVPFILGLEENLTGTFLNYVNELGYPAFGFEAGQHEAAESVDHHEAVIWTILELVGCLSARHIPEFDHYRSLLRKAGQDLPPVMELRYRHEVQPDHRFVMNPGFTNFTLVEQGQSVAHDRFGEIQVPESGRLFMPLYQAQGEDGFFLVREIKPVWLRLSALARRLGAEHLIRFLPGVTRHPDLEDVLQINTRVSKWFVLEICHLLGFRKHSFSDGILTVSRRKQHLHP